MNKNGKGEVNELRAAIHYIRLGWQVYWPGGHATGIDFVATKGPRSKRVQVKTVYECDGILRANIDANKGPRYSPDNVDVIVCAGVNNLWVIPLEDIEDITTLNFGRTDGKPSTTRTSFKHERYRV